MNTTDFCKMHHIRIESEYADENKNAPEWTDANHYKVTLKMGKKQFTTYYSMGYAITEEPQADDVLNCLALDSSSVENARDFSDFANELGYDDDSIKALHTYKVCVKQAKRLKEFLGEDLYNTLLWEVESL